MHSFELEDIPDLVRNLIGWPEDEVLEFKLNEASTERTGEYVSALANMAAVLERPNAYMVWGVDDETREIVGTRFNPHTARIKKQPLSVYLHQQLSDNARYDFYEATIDGLRVVVLAIGPAEQVPVTFNGKSYGRVESSKVELKSSPNLEREIWRALGSHSFEEGVAKDRVELSDVLRLLDPSPFLPANMETTEDYSDRMISELQVSGCVVSKDDGRYQITNLGAILFARNLDDFPDLLRKAPRLVGYRGVDRVETDRVVDDRSGYASGFKALLNTLDILLPRQERYEEGQRLEVKPYSSLLLREVVANALIHQDFTVRGAGPTIEVFPDRIEVTNPGGTLPAPDRLIDSPPRSRNEKLASTMRRLGFCEELGTGWDKIATETERLHLPSPHVDVENGSTRVVVYGPRELSKMDRLDQLRVVYMHASLLASRGERMTNATLRERFGIAKGNSSQVSRLIRDAVNGGQIVLYDENAGTRARAYVPYWAKPARRGSEGNHVGRAV